MTGFDWRSLMRAGLHDLRLDPKAFWALTPAELAVMLGQPQGVTPMSRPQLEALLTAYPDQRGQEHDGL
ncbi:rcc01693 family protein [Cognatishimia maritima]|uniref:Phage tail assembly chaperone protein, TAC n=1 Tax=Cognatishimia maritima TaxID=870908 RepID=A0A1M5JII1_9RHOB|nr:rcc01693 family protein [Cognatishimia maritima]SHG40069.1 phage conserved hypothetical protein [Cognatishimia maritima]